MKIYWHIIADILTVYIFIEIIILLLHFVPTLIIFTCIFYFYIFKVQLGDLL